MAKAVTVGQPFGKSFSSIYPWSGLANHLPFLNALARTRVSVLELQPTQGDSCVPVAALCFWMSFVRDFALPSCGWSSSSCCVWRSEALGLAGAGGCWAKGAQIQCAHLHACPAWVKTGVWVLLFVEEKRLEFCSCYFSVFLGAHC